MDADDHAAEREAGRTRSAIGGLALLAFGLFFAARAFDHPIGTPHRMGPGFFPLVVGIATALLGLAVAVARPALPGPPLAPSVRALGFISLGVGGFALAVEPFGLVPAAFASTLLTMLAEPRPRLVEAVAYGAAVAAVAWSVFVVGLGLPMTAFGAGA